MLVDFFFVNVKIYFFQGIVDFLCEDFMWYFLNEIIFLKGVCFFVFDWISQVLSVQ